MTSALSHAAPPFVARRAAPYAVTVPHRSFAFGSDKLRRASFQDLPPPTFSRTTLRRQSLAQSQPHYMDHAEFQRSRQPFPAPIVSKLPLSHRALSPASMMEQLRAEELHRVQTRYPSHRDKFQAGDRVCVTKYISLNDKTKVERVVGLVVSRHGGTGINARFTVRNVKLEESFELQFPLWSPFIVRIDVIEKGPRRHERRKILYMRERDRTEYETQLREALPKTAHGHRTLVKGSPMFVQREKELNDQKRREKDLQRHQRDAQTRTAQQQQDSSNTATPSGSSDTNKT